MAKLKFTDKDVIKVDDFSFAENGTIDLGVAKDKLPVGEELTTLQGKALKAFRKAVEKAGEEGGLEEDHLERLMKTYEGLKTTHGVEHEALKPVSKKLDAVKALTNAVTKKDEAAITAIMLREPHAANLLSETANATLYGKEFAPKLQNINKLIARHGPAEKALLALHETGTYDEKAIKAIFLDHGTDLAEHINPDLAQDFITGVAGTSGANGRSRIGPMSLQGIADEVKGEIDALKSTVAGKLDVIQAADEAHIAHRSKKNLAKVDEAAHDLKQYLEKHAKDNGNGYKAHLDKVFSEHTHFDRFKDLDGMKPLIADIEKAHAASPLGKAAGEVAKDAAKGRGFFTKLFEFKRTDAFMGELKTNNAAKFEELAKAGKGVGSTRWGKVVGAGAIATAAIVAAVSALGNKGPGENAQRVQSGRDEPQIAGSRA